MRKCSNLIVVSLAMEEKVAQAMGVPGEASSPRRKMNRGNLEACLRRAIHHTQMRALMVLMGGGDPAEIFDYRNRIVREEVQEALDRIGRIRQVAEGKEDQEILAILNEQFEFGHDL